MNDLIEKNIKSMYVIISLFTLICLVSLLVFKFTGLFDSLTSKFLMLEIVFIILLISYYNIYWKINIKNNDIRNLNLLLAIIFVGNMLYTAMLSFSLGRMFMTKFIQ